MSATKTALVIGGTGAMGRAVVRSLLLDNTTDWQVAIFSRSPDSETAQQLIDRGGGRVSFRQGNLNDEESLRQAMQDVNAVFCNTNFWSEASFTVEKEQGVRSLEVARLSGVEHFIYSSLDAVASLSGGKLMLPHYDAKAAVEHEIDWRRSDEYMRKVEDGWYSNHVSVLVTAPYFENFQSIFVPESGTLADGREGLLFTGPLSGDAPWQMVALDDIGYFVTMMLSDRETWGGRTLRVASDELPMAEIVDIFTQVTGIPAEYRPPTLEAFLSSGIPNAHDVVNNFRLYREGYAAPRDYELLRQLHPGLRTFADWLKESNWRGEARAVQKDPISGRE
ncbi:NmrA/HSCARG family protein [Oscillatoriales cyanobacterium LEGE 11467]|uniref:NmrA/HSCARG family protein n=1 Tax=Zarconia navalis LEGE 11467 TaxID=1828826 RepID=A0A928ZA24_9CYAN|nr:NmrA/HSCARG family protein [Zarconia navalis]MBE9042278.1 NmrA/HSCARG family protein [Zarconia navalis LEGE 11467]